VPSRLGPALIAACLAISVLSDCTQRLGTSIPLDAQSTSGSGPRGVGSAVRQIRTKRALRSTSAVQGPDTIYVSNACGTNSIEAFPLAASGNIAPTSTITGNATELSSAWSLAADSAALYAASIGNGRVQSYPFGKSGNVATFDTAYQAASIKSVVISLFQGISNDPITTNYNGNEIDDDFSGPLISGSNTGLSGPWGLAESGSTLIVSNYGSNSIETFVGPNAGNVAPSRKISGASTGIQRPRGVATDGAGNIYVANGDNSILVFAPAANGNVAPSRRIAGTATGLNVPTQLAVDAQNNLYVTNQSAQSVTVFGPSANGNVAPARVISGSSTGLVCPSGLALARTGDITYLYASTVFCDGSGGLCTDGPYGFVDVYALPAGDYAGTTYDVSYGGVQGIAEGPAGSLYLTANGQNADSSQYGASVAAFAKSSTGSSAGAFPVRYGDPTSIGADQSGDAYVLEDNTVSVASPSGSQLRAIGGSNTGIQNLHTAGQLFVEPNGGVYLANGGSVLYFAPGANGNVAPTRTIAGAATGITYTTAVMVDSTGILYVANVSQSTSILQFSPNAVGNVAPEDTISNVPVPNTIDEMASANGVFYLVGIVNDPQSSIIAQYVMNSRTKLTPGWSVQYFPGPTFDDTVQGAAL
jgi:hypothetical protein